VFSSSVAVRHWVPGLVWLVASVSVSCAQLPTDDAPETTTEVGADPDRTPLVQLGFGVATAGEVAILHAKAASEEARAEAIRVTAANGLDITVALQPVRTPHPNDPDAPWIVCQFGERTGSTIWSRCSDAEFAAQMAYAVPPPNAIMAFREPGTSAGEPSEETLAAVRAWVQTLGVVIVHEFVLSPVVSAQVPVDLAVVRALRADPRVRYLEPDVPGCWARGPCVPANVLVAELDLAALDPAPEPGTVLRAEYRPPDGSTLRAEVVVR
jgi:hypothetical protein